jgi:hypothetical protein
MLRRIAVALGIAGCLAGQAASAQNETAGLKLVVFPLQGVNVQASVARASTEVLTSALRNQGFAITDWEAPPPAPGDSAIVAADVPAGDAAAAPELTAQRKGEVARELGCNGYIDGKLVRLGTKVRVSINRRDLDGKVVDSRESEAKTEDDLVGVLERIAMAFAGNKTVDETLDLDNATMAETQRQAQRFRLEKNFGLVIGGMFGVADTMDTGVLIGFDGRLEIKQLVIILNAGLGIAAPDAYDDSFMDEGDNSVGMQVWLNLDVDGYLSHTPISPYIGAGVGMFIGGRVHMKDRDRDHDGITAEPNDTKYYDSKVGFDVHPTLGVEFLRHAAIRVHVEVRYSFDFAVEGAFGHGPMVFAGIDF